jgi:hypothetical protein
MPPQKQRSPFASRISGDPTMAFPSPVVAEDYEVGPLPDVNAKSLASLAMNRPRPSQGAGPLPVPPVAEQEALDQDTTQDSPMLQRLAALGIDRNAVDKVTPGWGKGYMASGATGTGPAQESTTRFGTAKIRPGAFAIGGVDPSQREFMVQRGNQVAEKSRRELSDFLSINAPTGNVDRYGTTDPMSDSRIRAGRAEAAGKANALSPLPEITVDDPEQVEIAGGQAAYNAQKLAEARLNAAISPQGQEAQAIDTRSKAQIAAAPYAMSIDAGADAKDAFLQFMFGKLAKQGASQEDIAFIAQATKMSPEEVAKIIAETSGAQAGVR